MAVYGGGIVYKGVEIMLWADPKRWRATLWKVDTSIRLKRMHDKDKARLVERAKEWIDEREA